MMTDKKKFYFLPIFVIKDPPGTVYPEERYIHYPWFEDRSGEHWAIVRSYDIVEGEECLSRGDELNNLKPALISVKLRKIADGRTVGFLGDLDEKWIARPRGEFLHLSQQEAIEKLRDPNWVRSVFGEAREATESARADEVLILDLQTGLLKRRGAN